AIESRQQTLIGATEKKADEQPYYEVIDRETNEQANSEPAFEPKSRIK
nr:hypothetical protein [Phycisphaerae bacterium]NIX30159.1 hypothetical protein [Phycisphaerae bacterium]